MPQLARHANSAPPRLDGAVTWRSAAVLALLTDGPGEPNVVLTIRAPDLTHDPGQLVLPGGAADAGHVDTALREAEEEIGLDHASVQVIGALPALALPQTRFLVTPVLAWSHQPRHLYDANPAEVSAVRGVALSARRSTEPERTDGGEGGVGVMTAAVLDLVAAASPAVEPVET